MNKRVDEITKKIYESRKEKEKIREEIVEKILEKILNIFQVSTDHAIFEEDMVWEIRIFLSRGNSSVKVKMNDKWHPKEDYFPFDSYPDKRYLYYAIKEVEEEIFNFAFSAPDKILNLLSKNLQGKKIIEAILRGQELIIIFSPHQV